MPPEKEITMSSNESQGGAATKVPQNPTPQNPNPQDMDEALKEFQKKFKAEMEGFLSGYDENGKPRILIAGATGCGKSTVCNLVFNRDIAATGSGEPITRGVKKLTVPDVPVIIYDSEGYETGARFSDRSGNAQDSGQKYSDIVMNAVRDEQIDLIWYCISAPGGRVTDVDTSLIKQFRALKKPVAVVLTQIDVATEEDCEELKRIIVEEVDGPDPDPSRKIAVFESTTDTEITVPQGIPELHTWSFDHLMTSRQDAFIISCRRGFAEKDRLAQKWIAAAATAAAGASFTPLPFSDTLIITPAQLTLYARLLHLWNMTDFEKILGTGLAETIMPACGRSLAGNLIKLIPGAGTVIGGLINATVASTLTYASGMALNKSCRLLLEKQLSGSVTAAAVRELLSSETITSAAQEYAQNYRRKKEGTAAPEAQ